MRYVQLGPKTAEELLNSQMPTICNMPAHLTIRLLSVIVIVWAACGLALLAPSALDKSICILALAVYSCGLVVSFRHEPKVIPPSLPASLSVSLSVSLSLSLNLSLSLSLCLCHFVSVTLSLSVSLSFTHTHTHTHNTHIRISRMPYTLHVLGMRVSGM
jgi:hypothetical protein